MSHTFKDDMNWSLRFVPLIKLLLADVLTTVAPFDVDTLEATDFLTLENAKTRIACRVRRWNRYALQNSKEFTIRAYRLCGTSSGTETELQKILSGWGDYILYAVSDRSGQDFFSWFLGDLNVFRDYWTWYEKRYKFPPGILKRTKDRKTAFYVVKLKDLPGQFVIARGGSVRERILKRLFLPLESIKSVTHH